MDDWARPLEVDTNSERAVETQNPGRTLRTRRQSAGVLRSDAHPIFSPSPAMIPRRRPSSQLSPGKPTGQVDVDAGVGHPYERTFGKRDIEESGGGSKGQAYADARDE